MQNKSFFYPTVPDYRSSYAAAVCLLLAEVGSPFSYTRLMGHAGLCFRFDRRIHIDRPELIAPYEACLCRAIGITAYQDERNRRQRIEESLANGIPVLYYEDGWKSFSPTEKGTVPDHTAARFFDKQLKPLSPEEALFQTLTLCVGMRAGDYDAFFDWMSALRQGTSSAAENELLLRRLLDARTAAISFLEQSAYLFNGMKAMMLSDSAKLYEMVCALLRLSLEQKNLDNSRQAERLKKILTSEKEIEYNFRYVLEHWQ